MDSTVRSRPSHYEVLGLAPSASSTEIGQAFAREIGSLMPRPFGHLAEVTVAYETLRDPAKRSAYDASLRPKPEPKPRHESAAFLGMALVDRLERPAVQPTPPPPPPVEPRPRPEPPFIAASPRQPDAIERPKVDRPRLEPQAGSGGSLHFAEAERLHFAEETPINRKLPLLAAGLLVLAVGFGAWTGLEAGNDSEQQPSEQGVTVKVPPVDALPITTEAPPAPAPRVAPTRAERRMRAARATQVAPAPASLEVEPPEASEPAQPQPTGIEQTGEEFPFVEVKPRKMPLPNAVIARTIGRIGYPCGQVASTTAGDGPGVFKVTCTSGHSYRAAPVRGRYHFRRLGSR